MNQFMAFAFNQQTSHALHYTNDEIVKKLSSK